MFERFVPLASFLHPKPSANVAEETETTEAATPPAPVESLETIRAARRFRAGLTDALDAAVEELLRAIGRDVLARELRLEGADLAAIVEAAVDRFDAEEVLRIRVHADDRETLDAFQLECIADDTLERGEVRFELRSGTIDLTFETRLEAAVRACAT